MSRHLIAAFALVCFCVSAVAQESGDAPTRPPELPNDQTELPNDQIEPLAPAPPNPPAPPAEAASVVTTLPTDARSTESPAEVPEQSEAKAEIHDNESFEPLTSNEVELSQAPSTNVLNDETPEWVKNGLVFGDDNHLVISSSVFPELSQCEEDLRSRLLNEVHVYLDKHVLEAKTASMLDYLTYEYVEENWIVPNKRFDNVSHRPSGTYHQLWIELQISSNELEKIRQWERSVFREQRTKQVGVLGGIGIAILTVFSGLVGVLARREQAKLKS